MQITIESFTRQKRYKTISEYIDKEYLYKPKESKTVGKPIKTKKKKSKKYGNRVARLCNTPEDEWISEEQWNKIIENQGNRCLYCGKKFNNKNPPNKDHIIPLSLGGSNRSDNIQALCWKCNRQKNTHIDYSRIQSWCFNSTK